MAKVDGDDISQGLDRFIYILGLGKQLPIPVGDGPYLQTSTRDSRVFGYCIDCRRHPLCPIYTTGVDVLISPVRPSTVQMSKVWTL